MFATVLLTLALGPGSAFEAALVLPKGLPIVELHANGRKPLRFIVDTGAGRSVIDAKVAERLNLTERGTIDAKGSGGTEKARIFTDFEVWIGEERTPLPAIGLDLSSIAMMIGSPFEGILGYDFFKGRIIEIDYAAKRLRIFARTGYAVPGGFAHVPVTLDGGRPFVRASAGLPGGRAVQGTFMFDTGANQAASFTERFVKSHGIETRESSSRLAGVGGARAASQAQLAYVEVGGLRFAVNGALVSDGADRRDGLLGSGLLQGRRLVVDYDGGRLYVSPPATTP